MSPPVDLLAPVLLAAANCAGYYLDPTPGRIFVAPGSQVAWDDCCEGQAWSRVVNLQPSGRPFPQVDYAQQCGVVMWMPVIAVGVLRCAHTVKDDGTAPTPAELTADALQMTADAAALRDALTCCLREHPKVGALRFVRWDPLGPQGGCVGGEWQVVVGLDTCACGDPAHPPPPPEPETEPDPPAEPEEP